MKNWPIGLSILACAGLSGAAFAQEPVCVDPLGDATLIVVVNPGVNYGVPPYPVGWQFQGIPVRVGNLPVVYTDASGTAIVPNLPLGNLTVMVGAGHFALPVFGSHGLFEAVVSLQGSQLNVLRLTSYSSDGYDVIHLPPGSEISSAATVSEAILRLAPGAYPGAELTGNNLYVLGACDQGELASRIDGDLYIRGNDIVVRSVVVTGETVITGNNITIAYSELLGPVTIRGNNVTIIGGSLFCCDLEVTGYNVLLLGSECLDEFMVGDLNCDCEINHEDIDPFVLALTDPAAYMQEFRFCDLMLADINRDGNVDNADIDPFVDLLGRQ